MNDPAMSASSPRLQAAVAEFLEAIEQGRRPDRGLLIGRYADVAEELAEFFLDHDRMGLWMGAGRQETEVGSQRSEIGGQEATVAPGDATASQCEVTVAPGERLAAAAQWQIGPYRVLEEIGRGGMGIVYKARHEGLGRVVALKTVLAGRFATREDRIRFQAEALAAAKLDHVGIVPIFEVGEAAGQPYLSMPLVEGSSLANRLLTGPLPPVEAARLLRKIVAAVSYAHARGVIHRDLKPGNILLGRSESSGSGATPLAGLDGCEPKITDFGLAKRLDEGTLVTASGQVLGTPNYMPPEQASGRHHEVGPAADIYALGAILYAMLTGRPPFQSENPVDVLLQVLEREPAMPSKLRAGVPRELEWICLKCLEKNPGDRYASAEALEADLDRFLRHEPPEARRPTPVQWLRRSVRRQPVLAGHLMGVGMALAVAPFVIVLGPPRALSYHVRVCGTLILWLLFNPAFHWLTERRRREGWPLYVWYAADALFLTAVLSGMASPLGALVCGYLLLIVTAGLAGQTQLVGFTTISSMLAYCGLLMLRPDAAPPDYALVALATMGITGLVVGYQVWRMGVLRDYYGDRQWP
jgi:serine/threonine-protein kinase